MIQDGDVLEFRNQTAYKVLKIYSGCLYEGELLVVRIDEDNKEIGSAFELKIDPSTPIVDIIR